MESFFSIYIHIPFCIKKCNYCAFYSSTDTSYSNEFIRSLKKEIDLNKDIINNKIKKLRSVYFGGGNPSSLEYRDIERIILLFYSIKKFDDLDEITFEANPSSLTEDKIKLIRDYGINRISLGLQSTNDRYLKFLGRDHSFNDLLNVYKKLDGFDVNIDLIYGLPQQKELDLLIDLKKVIGLRPSHISLYALEIHKNTPFYGKVKIDEEKQSKFYYIIKDFLEDKGYIHYEISNFSLPNKMSVHNINYWKNGDYLGFGPCASSHILNKRWANKSDIVSYINSLNNDKIELEYSEELTEKDMINERLILGLRMTEGINLNEFSVLKDKIMKMAELGYIEIIKNRARIKREFLFVSNYIISDMIL